MSEGQQRAPSYEARPEQHLTTKFSYRAEKLPTDPETVKALENWLNACGGYVAKMRLGLPQGEGESAELEVLRHTLSDAIDGLKGKLPKPIFLTTSVV